MLSNTTWDLWGWRDTLAAEPLTTPQQIIAAEERGDKLIN